MVLTGITTDTGNPSCCPGLYFKLVVIWVTRLMFGVGDNLLAGSFDVRLELINKEENTFEDIFDFDIRTWYEEAKQSLPCVRGDCCEA